MHLVWPSELNAKTAFSLSIDPSSDFSLCQRPAFQDMTSDQPTDGPASLSAANFLISPILTQSGATTFPDPFSILNPANPYNDHKAGPDFVFYSTQDWMMSFPNLTANSSPKVTVQSLNIDLSFLQSQINPKFAINGTLWSKNVFYDQATCQWHMIASVDVKEINWPTKAANGTNIWPAQYQTSIVHLSPNYTKCHSLNPALALSNITSWAVDGELVGSIPKVGQKAAEIVYDYANYAGKLVQDQPGEPIYLVYVGQLSGESNGIVAQPMLNAYTADTSNPPITLLSPKPVFNSEYRDGTSGLQLIETGNIVKVNQTWALLYTVGDYQTNDYKIGIAYSDALTGPFKKVLAQDINDVWGDSVHTGAALNNEIVYLLQNQKPNWFNFTSQVEAPGVPTILSEPVGGQVLYFLTFAGYPPGTPKTGRKYNPA